MQQDESITQLSSAPVDQLILKTGLPIIVSMMMQAAYNIVDSIFVANMPNGQGEAALNALTLAFPIQMLMVAIGLGTGVGMNVALSRHLGEGNQKRANQIMGNSFTLGVMIYCAFVLFGLFGTLPYLRSQTDSAEILGMAVSYLKICSLLSMGIVCFNLMEKLLQAVGRSRLSTIAMLAGAATNIVMDPILIYGYFGLPALGVAGAAYATVLGQIVSAGLGIFFHRRYDTELSVTRQSLRLSGSAVREIYTIGLPAMIAQALMSLMTYGLNLIFGTIHENLVTAYGLYYKIQQFLLFAAFGLRDAITPVISYNYGAHNRQRVKMAIRYGILDTVVIMVIGLVLLELLALPIGSLFGLSGDTEALCISAIRIISPSLLFAGVNIACQGVFQALDGASESLVLSVCRQLLFVLPVAWGFARIVKARPEMTPLVWVTFLIAEGVTALIAAVLLRGILRRRVDVL